MKEEYIVINLSKLKERIEELEKQPYSTPENSLSKTTEKRILKDFLSNSTPLNPLLENAFDANKCCNDCDKLTNKEDYINNLKIEI